MKLSQRYYETEEEFASFRTWLKIYRCPFCQQNGALILHGYLEGYDESESRIRRGHRIYCSNRNKKQGCGHTFCILKSSIIKTFMIGAPIICRLLNKLKQGKRPWRIVKEIPSISRTSVYRLCRRFCHQQDRMRTFLSRIKPPPNHNSDTPVIQTISHLFSLFPDCAVSGFQHFFQTPFF